VATSPVRPLPRMPAAKRSTCAGCRLLLAVHLLTGTAAGHDLSAPPGEPAAPHVEADRGRCAVVTALVQRSAWPDTPRSSQEVLIPRAGDIAPFFGSLNGRADALFVVTEPLTASHRTQIGTLASDARLPTMLGMREYVEARGLMSYRPSAGLQRRTTYLLIRFCAERSQVTFQSSSQPNSISWPI
jgi:hypothetical protein